MPDLTVEEAYEISRLRIAGNGLGAIGYKLGYTSAAMRQQMGISEPNYGILLAGSIIPDGKSIPMDELIHPLVEPEITFLLGSDLSGPDVDRDKAWEAIEAIMPSIEIVDTRYESYKFKAVDNIADNSSAARVVLGPMVKRDDAPDLRCVGVRLSQSGQTIDEGVGSNAMDDPVLALAWLANKLADTGSRLRAGELIMSGGLTRAHPAASGSVFSATFDGLGKVVAMFGGASA